MMKSLIDKVEVKSENGAVTFLDVLGWKGIWQENRLAIETLHSLIIKVRERSKEISNEYMDDIELRGKSNITTVLSISDTIAIFTSAPPKIAIEIHARICSWLLEYSLSQGIPVRGAISYGEYSIKDNIMLGYAVDESASWHETTDWIGVILTPSAKYQIDSINILKIIAYNQIPYKKVIKNLNLCVDWNYQDKNELYKIIQKKGPHIPEIAPKYLNTSAFFNRSDNA